MPPSSTSSSDIEPERADGVSSPAAGALPVAGVLAAVLVLVLDGWVFGDVRLWQWFDELVESDVSMDSGIIRDQLAFDAMASADDDRVQACVIGTSRARRGLLPMWITPLLQGKVDVSYLAHAGMQPFEVRGLVGEIIDSGVDVAVLSLSEFDTHRPLKLSAATAAGSVGALYDLGRFAGLGLVRREREAFLRVSLAALLEVYRFRQVQRAAGLGELLGFRRPDSGPPKSSVGLGFALGADGLPGEPLAKGADGAMELYGVPQSLYHKVVDQLSGRFPELSLNARRAELRQILSISEGVHAHVQMELLGQTVEALTDAGVDVLLYELPLYPPMGAYYEASTRQEFITFARDLAANERVHFVPQSTDDPVLETEYVDLTHVSNRGSKRLSEALVSALLDVVERREADGKSGG